MSEKVFLNEKTWIPLSAVVLVFGATAWLTQIYTQGQANAHEITEIKKDNEKSLDKIDQRLERIEEKMDRLIDKSKIR